MTKAEEPQPEEPEEGGCHQSLMHGLYRYIGGVTVSSLGIGGEGHPMAVFVSVPAVNDDIKSVNSEEPLMR